MGHKRLKDIYLNSKLRRDMCRDKDQHQKDYNPLDLTTLFQLQPSTRILLLARKEIVQIHIM